MSTPLSPPEAKDLALLIKLLKLTTSSHDAEALAAMRKANSALDRLGGDWEALLLGRVTIIADPFTNLAPPPKPQPKHTHPAPPPPPPSPHATRPPPVAPIYRRASAPLAANTPLPSTTSARYDGRCYCCAAPTTAGSDFIFRRNGKWASVCAACNHASTVIPASPATPPRFHHTSIDDL